jgi:hypothetical protein
LPYSPSEDQVTPALLYGTDKGRLIYDENDAAAGGRTVAAMLQGAPNLRARPETRREPVW